VNGSFTDLSSGGNDKVRVQINTTAVGCSTCYQIRITNVVNQRTVGVTPDFILLTITTDKSQQIITGSATATIINYNSISGQFSPSDDYYRSNVNPVNIILNVTNPLTTTDYI